MFNIFASWNRNRFRVLKRKLQRKSIFHWNSGCNFQTKSRFFVLFVIKRFTTGKKQRQDDFLAIFGPMLSAKARLFYLFLKRIGSSFPFNKEFNSLYMESRNSLPWEQIFSFFISGRNIFVLWTYLVRDHQDRIQLQGEVSNPGLVVTTNIIHNPFVRKFPGSLLKFCELVESLVAKLVN